MIPHSEHVVRALKALPQSETAEEMLSAWADTKKEIAWLVENDYPMEAERLSSDYVRSFAHFKHEDEGFTLKVAPAFPVNNRITLELLGISDELDDYLIKHKVRVNQLTQDNQHGFRQLIAWAAWRQKMPLITEIVTQLAKDLITNHPDDVYGWSDVCQGMIRRLTDKDGPIMKLGGEIDRALASIVAPAPDSRIDGKEMIPLAKFGLRETLLKMLSVGTFRQFRPIAFTPEEVKLVLDMLPSEPTSRQLHGMHLAIDMPCYAEKILFDPSVDMKDYIEALRTSDMTNNKQGNDLNYTTLRMFIRLLNPEHLNTTDRRRRARMLVNAVCEEENRHRKESPEAIWYGLKSMGYNDCVLRMCDDTKVVMLEDELGM